MADLGVVSDEKCSPRVFRRLTLTGPSAPQDGDLSMVPFEFRSGPFSN
jgi:hypothetical protein